MPKLRLTVATWDYDRVRPIMDGRVRVEGCDVNYISLPPEELFHRVVNGDFEVSEIGFSSYLAAVSRDIAPYVAVPVFLSRMFRHSSIYIRTDRGIERPADLRGKTVGIPEYSMAVGLWVRGMLNDDHGVAADAVQWRQGGLDQPGRLDKYPMALPDGFPLKPIGPTQTLDQMLRDGELDALLSARTPRAYSECQHVVRLFEDFADHEREYFRRTGLFPIMHALGVRRDVHERHPWLAASLYKAYARAKALAQEDLLQTAALKVSLPWVVTAARDTQALMGEDFWPYGVERNRHVLDTLTRYAFEQGLSTRRVSVEELFAQSTLVEPKT